MSFKCGEINAENLTSSLTSLKDDLGAVVEGVTELGQLARAYFLNIFSAGGSIVGPVTAALENRVTEEQNRNLETPFTREEIRLALFSMGKDKTPGPDGFNPGFFQHYWQLVGDEVSSTCIEWLTSGVFPEAINNTTIVLIPKIDKPNTMKDLRPISLCNVLYRVVAKVLANRLRRVAPSLVESEQSAFIKGRLMTLDLT